MRSLSLSLLASLVLVDCARTPPPITLEGEGEEGEGEGADEGEGEGEGAEGEGESAEGEGEGEGAEGEGEGEGAGEGEGEFDLPPIVFVTPEGSFCGGNCALQVGRTLQLTAIAIIGGAPVDATPTWSVDDDSIATIDAAGLVTGVAAGTVTVTADVEGTTGELLIDVSDGPTPARVEVTPEELTLDVGATAVITAVVFDDADNVLDDVEVTFTAPNEAVATVDVDGTVLAIAAGTTLVFVQAGPVNAIVNVTVNAP